eukprot:2893885-Rhodomonas_salina.1
MESWERARERYVVLSGALFYGNQWLRKSNSTAKSNGGKSTPGCCVPSTSTPEAGFSYWTFFGAFFAQNLITLQLRSEHNQRKSE